MLTTLAPLVPKDLLTDAVAAAAGIDDGMLRVTALSALALHVPEPARADVVSMTLASARSIDDESERTAALAAMAPFLPESFFEVILAGRPSDRTGEQARRGAGIPRPLPLGWADRRGGEGRGGDDGRELPSRCSADAGPPPSGVAAGRGDRRGAAHRP